MTRRFVQQLLLLSLICTLASCPGNQPERSRPNVLLIVLDTVRADHLSCYGYARHTTPNIDAFASQADRYTLARSTAPWTLPSHASLFTGLFPFQHHADAYLEKGLVQDARPLAPEFTTLAEALRDEGFATGGFAANRGYLREGTGMEQGFQKYVCDRRDAPLMSKLALDWLAEPTTKPPFFVFVNYMDAHRTYNTKALPEPRASELPAPPPEGKTGDDYLDELCESVLGTDQPPSPELVQKTIDAYDLALANLDAGVGELLDGLKKSGHFDDTLIVICADHGEYFGEHDLVEHSKDVYETALRIPLIVKRPAQKEGRVIDDPISIADVAKVVLASMPRSLAERHLTTFPGTSGVGSMTAQINYTRPKDLNKPWGQHFRRVREALYEGRYKLIRSSDGKNELYDLQIDPGEQHNLFAERGVDATKLMQRLETLEQKATAPSDAHVRPPTPEELKELHKLGYIDDGSPTETKGK